MARIRNKRNEKRVKLYRKVRNVSSWGTLCVLLFLNVLFIVAALYIAGFNIQYFFETKLAENYTELEHVAKLYEAGRENEAFLKYIESGSIEFIVRDKSGNVVYQKGENTCAEKGGLIGYENSTKFLFIYPDTRLGVIKPGKNEGIDPDLISFFDYLKTQNADLVNDEEKKDKDKEEDKNTVEKVDLPYWVRIDNISDSYEFIGKAYFSYNERDAILLIEILLASTLIVGVAFVVLIVFMIRSIINFRRVVRLFYTDPVTGGHNWIWFVMGGDEKLGKRKFRKFSFAVVNLAFTNYRNYCMCHSISEGEEVLIKIDKSLNKQIRNDEMCARASTDGFALLLFFVDEQTLRKRLQTMMDVLQNVDKDHNFVFQTGVDIIRPEVNSAGKIVSRDASIEKAYNNACTAVTAQGETDPAGVFIFDERLLQEQRWFDMVQESQMKAVENNEFEIYYQPKYDPRTLELKGAEALIRWNSPEHGFVSPGRFIPIFEKNGFITEIDHYMISHVAADQKMWLDMGYHPGCVSVNVSRAHFAEKDLAIQIRDMVNAAGCPHDLLEIELTESAFFDDQNAMIETIKALKSFGFKVSMDDFGAGYSSLNSLKDMPLDVLKLDAGFFRGDKAGDRGGIVVAETIKLAKSLHMKTVAEGVEEKEQVEFLASQGCDMIQGYYFAKPMPKSDYMQQLAGLAHAAPVQAPVPVQQVQPVAAPAPAVEAPQPAPQQPITQPVIQPMQTIVPLEPVTPPAAPAEPVVPQPQQPQPGQLQQ